ncbi:uncharacterized protein IL334_003327 [Kwoniella shivajii]|uniref:CID domain-containing protein n=1 Tax=Kwoniella shivajii TaxID=564305 RepID=A0ABZ1D1C8_9TREE|nr:hypothetical protein IL334_003327 [Kwoniella shivajii]
MSYQTYPPYQQLGSYYPPPQPQSQLHQQHLQPQPPHDPFRAYYADRLRQLTFNSRPIIQDLSMMAGAQRDQNNWEGMNTVVQEIEAAVLRALPNQKLPLLYLIDSISKNIGPPYTTHLLPPVIPRLYLRTYREVDGVTKAKMEEMINLWRSGGPNRTELYGIEVRESIEREIFGSSGVGGGIGGGGLGGRNNLNVPLLPSLQQVKKTVQTALDNKQKEAASKAWDMATGQQVNALTGILNLLNQTSVSPNELVQIMEQVKSIASSQPQPQPQPPLAQPVYSPPQSIQQPATPNWGAPIPNTPSNIPHFPHAFPGNNGRQIPPQIRQNYVSNIPTPPQVNLNTPLPGSVTPVPAPNPVLPAAISMPSIANLPIDVSKILNSLNKSGVVSQNRTPEPQAPPPPAPKSGLDSYEDMILSMNISLRSIDLNAIHVLSFDHLPHRCKQCGMRFAGDDSKFQAHMDWHFRRNRKEREAAGRGAHRRWLPRAEEWINDTFASDNEPGPSSSTINNSPGKTSNTATVSAERLSQLRQKWVKVPQDSKKALAVCPVCKESFVKEWSEDDEEWIWKNALNINGTIYHATCRAEQLSAMRRLKGTDPNRRSNSGSPRLTPQPEQDQAQIQVKSEMIAQANQALQANQVAVAQAKRKAEEEEDKTDEGAESKRVKVEPESHEEDQTMAEDEKQEENVQDRVSEKVKDEREEVQEDKEEDAKPDPHDDVPELEPKREVEMAVISAI